jgi:hypothetical protein
MNPSFAIYCLRNLDVSFPSARVVRNNNREL